MARSQQPDTSTVGGLAFFLSLFACLALVGANVLALPAILSRSTSQAWLAAGVGTLGGILLSTLLVRDYLHVFLHEQRHAILANLAGNRARGMKVRRQAGHFEYAYSKATAHLNAFIALAPYFLPLALILMSVLAAVATSSHPLRVGLVTIGYGFDLRSHLIDISPAQTDLTTIRGGFWVGALYVFLVQLLIATTLLAWIADGRAGLWDLGRGLFGLLHAVIQAI